MSDRISFSHINVEQCRKQAKELVKAHKAGDPKALDRLRWNHPRFRGQQNAQIAKGRFVLADAQLVIARLHYFASWRKMLDYVASQERSDPVVARFEDAADLIIAGDIDRLRAMLDANPELIYQRSTRAHHSTLLHYTSANGVEDYRQITPPNIVDITRLLLDRGAEVDATSEAYGGGSTTLGLASTSAHPRARGVQIELIDLLLEYGAKIDGENDLQNLVSGALGNGCPEAAVALANRGAHVQTLYAAAGVGDLERVRIFFGAATKTKRENALAVAAQQGHINIATYLLDNGVDVNSNGDMPPLHSACSVGHIDVAKLLIERGADLEAFNAYGGTALSSTLWFAYNVNDSEFESRDLVRVIEFLVETGANVDFYPELREEIAGVYRRAETLGVSPAE